MANKGRKQRANTKANTQPPPSGFDIEVDYSPEFETYYSNFAGITHTPADLAIDFCLIAPPHDLDLAKRTLRVPIIARVMITPSMATGLIEALQTRLKRQEDDSQKASFSLPVTPAQDESE